MKKVKQKKELTPERRKKRKRRRIILLSIVCAFIIFRLFLPSIVLRYVNNKLANLKEYYGHVNDIDIHLYRGAYVIKDMELIKRNKKSNDTLPFFYSPKIDLSVEWSSLMKGDLVGEIELTKPRINFVRGVHKGEDIKADTADFSKLVRALMPFSVNRFEIFDGEFHYIDFHTHPHVHLILQNINAKGTNLSNVEKKKDVLPATLTGTGDAYEGEFDLVAKYDALAIQPTFDFSLEMEGMNLVLVNDFLRAYGNFDVKKGNFDLYAEFAANEGKFGGYVKPILKDLNIAQWNKEEGNVLQIFWESFIGVAAEVLQNQPHEQLALKIPINGSFSDPKVEVWNAIGSMLKNAFIHVLEPSVDNTINIDQLEGKKPRSKKSLRREEKREDRRTEKKTKSD